MAGGGCSYFRRNQCAGREKTGSYAVTRLRAREPQRRATQSIPKGLPRIAAASTCWALWAAVITMTGARLRPLTGSGARIPTVHHRHSHVEENRRGWLRNDLVQRGCTIRCNVDGVSGVFERQCNEIADVVLIVDSRTRRSASTDVLTVRSYQNTIYYRHIVGADSSVCNAHPKGRVRPTPRGVVPRHGRAHPTNT